MSCYPPSSWIASRLTRADEEKMLLTDLCNRLTTRAPVDCSIPERVTFVDADRHPASLRHFCLNDLEA